MSKDRGWYYDQGPGWVNDNLRGSPHTSGNRSLGTLKGQEAAAPKEQPPNGLDMLVSGSTTEFAHLTDEGLAEFSGRVHAEITRRQLQRGGGGQ